MRSCKEIGPEGILLISRWVEGKGRGKIGGEKEKSDRETEIGCGRYPKRSGRGRPVPMHRVISPFDPGPQKTRVPPGTIQRGCFRSWEAEQWIELVSLQPPGQLLPL